MAFHNWGFSYLLSLKERALRARNFGNNGLILEHLEAVLETISKSKTRKFDETFGFNMCQKSTDLLLWRSLNERAVRVRMK